MYTDPEVFVNIMNQLAISNLLKVKDEDVVTKNDIIKIISLNSEFDEEELKKIFGV